MNRHDFTHDLEAELRLRGVPFDLHELQEFLASAWPLIEDKPDVGRWAEDFQAAQATGAMPTAAIERTDMKYLLDDIFERAIDENGVLGDVLIEPKPKPRGLGEGAGTDRREQPG